MKKVTLVVKPFVKDENTQSHIDKLRKETVEKYLDHCDLTEEHLMMMPVLKDLGEMEDYSYHALYFEENNVGYLAFSIDCGVLQVQEFYVQDGYRSSKNYKGVIDFLKQKGKELGCKTISIDVFYSSELDSILKYHKATRFTSTYRIKLS